MPVILNSLGEKSYGTWALLGSVFSYSTVLSLGINSAINREIPVFVARRQDEGLSLVTSTATAFFTVVALVCVLFTVVLYFGFTGWFAIGPEAQQAARISVLVLGVYFVLSAPLQPFSAVLSGYQRYDLLTLSQLVPLAVRAVLIVTLLTRKADLVTMAVIFSATELAIHLLKLLFAIRLLPPRVIRVNAISYEVFRKMLAFGVNTFLYTAGALVMAKTTEVLLGLATSTELVARYTVASSAVLVLGATVECFCGPLKPMVSDLDARGKRDELLKVAFAYEKIVLLVSIPAVAFLVVMGGDFLVLWTHRDMPQAATVLSLLAIGYLFRLSQHSNFMVLNGMGEHRVFGVITVCMAVASISLAGLFIALGWGIVGAALGNMIALVLFGVAVLPRIFRTKMRVPPWQSLVKSWKPAIISNLPVVALLFAWKWFRPPQSVAELVLGLAAVGFVIAIATWKIGLEEEEKSLVCSFLRIGRKVPLFPTRLKKGR